MANTYEIPAWGTRFGEISNVEDYPMLRVDGVSALGNSLRNTFILKNYNGTQEISSTIRTTNASIESKTNDYIAGIGTSNSRAYVVAGDGTKGITIYPDNIEFLEFSTDGLHSTTLSIPSPANGNITGVIATTDDVYALSNETAVEISSVINPKLSAIAELISTEVDKLDTLSNSVATKQAVNTAIDTINTNFTNLESAIGGALANTISVSVLSVASGFSFSSAENSTYDNKVKFFHWGSIGYVIAGLKTTNSIAANSRVTSIGTISLPSGYVLRGGFFGHDPSASVFYTSNGAGQLSFYTIAARSANAVMSLRMIAPLANFTDKYSKTTVSNL